MQPSGSAPTPSSGSEISGGGEWEITFSAPLNNGVIDPTAFTTTGPGILATPLSAEVVGGKLILGLDEAGSPPHVPGTLDYDGSDPTLANGAGQVAAFSAFPVS